MTRDSIEDRLAIESLFVRYTRALDTGDVDGVANCFTKDGFVESPIVGRFQGREELVSFAKKTAEAIQHGARFRHFVSNFEIELSTDWAKAKCYLLDVVTIGGKTELLSPGEYECEVEKVAGEWLFVSRIVRMDRPFTIPRL